MLFRGISVLLIIIVAESINGTVRQLVIAPMISDLPARRVSFAVAIVLITAITFLFIKWIRASGYAELLALGGVWVLLMLGFEFGVGHFVFAMPLDLIASDYDPRRGGLMTFGMLYLSIVPSIAFRIRR